MSRIVIENEDFLYRRIYKDPWKKYVNPDNTPTSRNFVLRKAKNETSLSVDIAKLTTPEQAVGDTNKFAIAAIQTLSVRELGLDAIHEPCTIEIHGFENYAHASITGIDEDDEIIPALLARKAKVL